MVAIVENGPVRPHVQAFANEGRERFGTRFTTYPGHSPTQDRALDCWDTDADMDGLVQFGRDNYKRFGIDYIIWQQRIWNPEISDSWRWMPDRGSRTANHYDHGHFSFEPTGGDSPTPKPKPDVQGDLAMLTFRYIYDGQDWVFDGPSKLFFQLNDTRQITEVLDKLGVKAIGQVSDATHSRYSELAASAGFSG